MKQIVMTLYLLWGTLQDVKEKKISVTYLKIGALLSFLYLLWEIWNKNMRGKEVMLSLLPGVIFLLLSKLTKEKVGVGDGFVFLVIGICLGSSMTWMVCQLGLILSSVYSLLILLLKRGNRESQIAFIPFIWLAHFLLWSLKYG